MEVPVRTLDSFGLTSVGFIKIDVEGHELAVLQGACKTIALSHPILMVEVEDRHRHDAVHTVEEFLSDFGYSKWTFDDARYSDRNIFFKWAPSAGSLK